MGKLYINCTYDRDIKPLDIDYYEALSAKQHHCNLELQTGPLLNYTNLKLQYTTDEVVLYGEPFLRKDIMYLLDYLINKKNRNVILLTSGVGMELYLEELRRFPTNSLLLICMISNTEIADYFYTLQCSTINYFVGIDLLKTVNIFEVVSKVICTKSQNFLIRLPLLGGEFKLHQISEQCYNYEELSMVIDDLFSIANTYPNNVFCMEGLPYCELKATNKHLFKPANFVLASPLTVTQSSSVINPSKIINFGDSLRNLVTYLGNCEKCEHFSQCTGFRKFMVTETTPPMSCRLDFKEG